MKDYMLTTTDNPYNPFTEFDEWHQYDIVHGYDCCGLVARVNTDWYFDMPVAEAIRTRKEAIDNIIRLVPTGVYGVSFAVVSQDIETKYVSIE